MVYRLGPDWSATPEQLEENLEKQRFVPCGLTQQQSIGWIEPRGVANAALLETQAGHWLCKLQVESKVLPASVVKRRVEERVRLIETQEGRKPGKKERRELADDVLLELLPVAFTKQSAVLVWIDPAARLLVLGAASQGRADAVMSLLVEAIPGLVVAPLQTALSPSAAMADWLSQREAPSGFSIDRECELKAADENKASVKYAKHALDIDEVPLHIQAGKLPTRLAMTWSGRVSFVHTDTMQIKRLKFLEGVFENTSTEKEDQFDADLALSTGELSRLLPELLEALGGELALGMAAAAVSAPASTATTAASAAPAATATPTSAATPAAGSGPSVTRAMVSRQTAGAEDADAPF